MTFLLDHFKRLVLRSDLTQTTSQDIAASLGPAIFCPAAAQLAEFDRQGVTSQGAAATTQGVGSHGVTSLRAESRGGLAADVTSQLGSYVELLQYLIDIWPKSRGE